MGKRKLGHGEVHTDDMAALGQSLGDRSPGSASEVKRRSPGGKSIEAVAEERFSRGVERSPVEVPVSDPVVTTPDNLSRVALLLHRTGS